VARPEQPAKIEVSFDAPAAPAAPADSEPAGKDSAPPPRVPRPAEPPPRPASDGPGDGAGSSTGWKEPVRRRPVVFDEDDDLDVPDFLK
jgi:cell division protein FtsZ